MDIAWSNFALRYRRMLPWARTSDECGTFLCYRGRRTDLRNFQSEFL